MQPIKKRELLTQVLLFVVTCGLYQIYWFYQTATELKDIARDEQASPALWTVLFFIPFGALYSLYKYSELYESVSNNQYNRWLIFILWLFFSPAVWFIVQTDLNKRADLIALPSAV